MEYDFGSEWLSMYCLAGYVGDGDPETVYSALLQANLFWAGTEGATLGVAPADGAVYLSDKKPLDVLGPAELQAWLETFLHTATQYRALLDALDGSPGDEDLRDEDSRDEDLRDEEPESTRPTDQSAQAAKYGNRLLRP